jgi:signal transduction histidine kinase
MPAKLTLTHKLCLAVLVPLSVNVYLYSETQRQVKSLEKQVEELESRRSEASTANSIITNEVFALQALMQYKMFRDKKDKIEFDSYMQKMHDDIAALEVLLTTKLNDPASASKIHFLYAELLHSLKESDFRPDVDNQFGSFFEDLERNQRVKRAMISLIETLRAIDKKAKIAVETGVVAETAQRAKFRNFFDLTLLLNSLFSAIFALYVTQFIVRRVTAIRENYRRLADHQPLLPSMKSDDELGELDNSFRAMAENLEAGRQAQLEMMQQIASSRDKLQTVIDALPSALFITDSEGRVESVNKFAKDCFNIDLNYFHEQPLTKLFQLNPEMRPNFMTMLARETANAPMDLFAVSAEKELVPVKVSTVSFDSNDKQKYLTVVTDETESFRLKQAKSDFFSMVSHDMRTPLSTISGVLQMAVKGAHGELNKETSDRLNVALHNSSVLLELVNRLLQIEQIATSDIELNPEVIDISDIATEVVSLIAPQLEGKNLKLFNEIQSQSVFADRSYIQEVVMNLVSNAIKYSPEGGEIRLSNKTEDKQTFFEVADQGPGVPASKKGAIFERYKQADKKRDSKIGFGLGLAICKAIVSQHGGSIGVRDADGKGSIFWFSLESRSGN